ncbi:hypothetical protein U1Q18_005445, partial [Sarracenia purpurea var. burkii]
HRHRILCVRVRVLRLPHLSSLRSAEVGEDDAVSDLVRRDADPLICQTPTSYSSCLCSSSSSHSPSLISCSIWFVFFVFFLALTIALAIVDFEKRWW